MAKSIDARDAVTATDTTGSPPRSRLWLVDFYGSDLGKKYAMAISGVVLMGYVLLHMIGNLKLYFGQSSMNEYAEWLRTMGEPALPYATALWGVRILLLAAFIIHIHAATVLTLRNRKARPEQYASKRDYIVADIAGRSMRWTGVIILLFVLFHLADLTFGYANPSFDHADAYGNVVASFSRPAVSALYIIANLALALHLYHGAWSLFQSMGWNRPRFNHWRRWFAVAFAVVVAGGNISFPIAVMTGIVS